MALTVKLVLPPTVTAVLAGWPVMAGGLSTVRVTGFEVAVGATAPVTMT